MSVAAAGMTARDNIKNFAIPGVFQKAGLLICKMNGFALFQDAVMMAGQLQAAAK